MRKYFVTSQQINPIVPSVAADLSSRAGVQLETRCACWELRVFASLVVDPTVLNQGITVDGVFYPFQVSAIDLASAWATANFIISSMNKPHPEVLVNAPVSISFQTGATGPLATASENPLYLDTYFLANGFVQMFSVSFHRGFFETI